MIAAITAILILTVMGYAAIRLALNAYHRIRYALEVRHLPKVTEWQARQNAAPLSNAIMERTVYHDRGD